VEEFLKLLVVEVAVVVRKEVVDQRVGLEVVDIRVQGSRGKRRLMVVQSF
jgi:hypothetical protein